MLNWPLGRRLASLFLVLSLTACGGGGGGATSPLPTPAEAPVARISALGVNADSEGAMRGGVNGVITLDASASTTSTSSVLSYAWALSMAPSGSKASLSNAAQKAASLTPDLPGKYQVTLTLTSSAGSSATKTVDLQIAEAPPVANIIVTAVYTGSTTPVQIASLDGTVGSVYTLDSSQLKANDGTAVSTTWSVDQQPAGSLAKLQGNGSKFQYTPDLMGMYILRARVRDNYGNYSDALYTLRMVYAPPSTSTMIVAPNFSATPVEQATIDSTLGTNFVLDTASLRASDGGAVRTIWKVLQRPDGSSAPLTGTDPLIQFRPDQMGLYKLHAHVEDGRGAYSESIVPIDVRYMAPATASILVNNSFTGTTITQAPISASLGSVFSLDTTSVRVLDGSPVSTAWEILEQPSGSRAQLSGSGTRFQYTPDVLGSYKLKVRVQDIRGAWGESIYTLSVLNRPPEANASVNAAPVAAISYGNARVQSGASMTLRGGASFDADGDTLSYSWSLLSAPAASTARLSTSTTVDTHLNFDVDGDYTIQLRVTDPQGAYSDRQVLIKVGDAPPVIVYDHNNWTAILGSNATANAGFSYSPQARPLSYQWTLDSRPAGSSTAIPTSSSAQLSFTPDLPGTYIASVVVSDGTLRSVASFTLRVLANSERTTELGFKPLIVRYSKGLDQLVMTSASPNLLSFVDPFSGLLRSVPLLAAPTGLSVSPDGKLALVLYGSVVDLFDVATGNRIRSSNTLSIRSDAVLLNTGEALLYGGDQWSGGPGLINARTGAILSVATNYGAGTFWGNQQYGIFADKLNTAFSTSSGLSPSKLTYLKLDPKNAAVALGSGDWPYHGDYYASAPIALNTSQTLVFDSSGLAAKTSDLRFAGRINLGGNFLSISASSDDAELLALQGPAYSWNTGLLSSSYAQIDPVLLLLQGTLNFPSINSQQSYGLALFHSTADRHVGVVQTGGNDAATTGKRYWVFAR
ncbi:hypothetical protein HNP55_001113 [Paucibacter oligotrophus]|uniref:PKD domain-containing protein n=1 Tax=Roseateles oligotrophus TaxID=1769250 RepID=A0A840L8R3_9BURK|nr:PKD domain-containing protein [Roseateles oligotrophus]MBB4842598.1 hypothetical protein [Roseateles oligotrophus]